MASITDRIREILGDTYTEDIGSDLRKLIGTDFVPRSEFNEKNQALKDANGKIAELSANDWKKQYEALEKSAADNLAKSEAKHNEFRLSVALKDAKARNPKAVRALLDHAKITYSDDGIDGLDDQLTALRKSDGYLFADSQTSAGAGTGGFPGGANGGAGNTPPVIPKVI